MSTKRFPISVSAVCSNGNPVATQIQGERTDQKRRKKKKVGSRRTRHSIKIRETRLATSQSIRCKFPRMPISVCDLIARPRGQRRSHGARTLRGSYGAGVAQFRRPSIVQVRHDDWGKTKSPREKRRSIVERESRYCKLTVIRRAKKNFNRAPIARASEPGRRNCVVKNGYHDHFGSDSSVSTSERHSDVIIRSDYVERIFDWVHFQRHLDQLLMWTKLNINFKF